MLIRTPNDLISKLNESVFSKPMELRNKPWILKKMTKNTCIVTLGNKVYKSPEVQITYHTVMHEAQHYADQCVLNKKTGKLNHSFIKTILFYFRYSLPQILGLFSVLSILYIFWWYMIFFLLFMVFLLPNPHLSGYRFKYEIRGYFWNYYAGKQKKFASIFNSWTYFKMDILRPDSVYTNIMDSLLLPKSIDNDYQMKKLLEFYNNCTFII